MTRYTGNHCPVCEQAFTDEDDIVVCPDCGTPYHRACWQKVGACMHKSEHAAGFEWQPEFGPEAEKAAHVNIINVQGFGQFGRVYIAGDEAEVVESYRIVETRLKSLSGRSEGKGS